MGYKRWRAPAYTTLFPYATVADIAPYADISDVILQKDCFMFHLQSKDSCARRLQLNPLVPVFSLAYVST